MKSKKQKMIDFLLKNANPSIKRRVKSEILHNLIADEAALYQEQIMQEETIQRIISCQQENGWIGKSLHGGLDTQEGATKYLAEKAVDKETPVFKWAMEAFASIPLDDWCYDTKGKIIDEFKVTGHGTGGYLRLHPLCPSPGSQPVLLRQSMCRTLCRTSSLPQSVPLPTGQAIRQ